jgi:hypothetical protein
VFDLAELVAAEVPQTCSLKVPTLSTRCMASPRAGGLLRGWRFLTPTNRSKEPATGAHTEEDEGESDGLCTDGARL